MTRRAVEDYLRLPYTVTLKRDEDGDIVARISELPGCATHGASESEALERLREVQRLWIEEALSSRQPIPPPHVEEKLPSGRWLQRAPRSLHKKLIEKAKRDGVSLNQLVNSLLAESVGRTEATSRALAAASPPGEPR